MDEGELNLISANDLPKMELVPPKFIVPELIVSGLNILAGTPKSGKSWLTLKLAAHVAKGQTYLGLDLEPQRVLYLGLEDTLYRLRNRLLGTKSPFSSNLVFATEFPWMENGGLEKIHSLIHRDEFSLVVIDTLGRFSHPTRRGNAYEEDTERAEALQQTAFAANAAILVVHHLSKGAKQGKDGADFIQSMSGSQGLPGAADVLMGFQRVFKSEVSKLHITGRDIKSQTMTLAWSSMSGGWQRE